MAGEIIKGGSRRQDGKTQNNQAIAAAPANDAGDEVIGAVVYVSGVLLMHNLHFVDLLTRSIFNSYGTGAAILPPLAQRRHGCLVADAAIHSALSGEIGPYPDTGRPS
jgi:hypothetical protein